MFVPGLFGFFTSEKDVTGKTNEWAWNIYSKNLSSHIAAYQVIFAGTPLRRYLRFEKDFIKTPFLNDYSIFGRMGTYWEDTLTNFTFSVMGALSDNSMVIIW